MATQYDPINQGFQDLQSAFMNMQQLQGLRQREEAFKLQKKQMEVEAGNAKLQREALEQGQQGLQQAFSKPLEDPQQLQGPPTPDGQVPMSQGYTEQDRQAAMLQAGLQLSQGGNPLGNEIAGQVIQPITQKSKYERETAELEKVRAETKGIDLSNLNKQTMNEQAKLDLAQNQGLVESRGELVRMLEAQAQEASNPDVKNRLNFQKAALSAAQTPEQIASVVTDVVGIKPTLYQSLLQNGVSPVEAFRTGLEIEGASAKDMEQFKTGLDTASGKEMARFKSGLDVSAGKELESFRTSQQMRLEKSRPAKTKDPDKLSLGDAYKARAKAMFDKTVDQLDPVEMDGVIKAVNMDKRVQQVEGQGDKPLELATQDKLSALQDIITEGEKVVGLLTPDMTGALTGPINELAEKFGMADPRFTTINTGLSLVKEQLGRLQSMGAISNQELANFNRIVGDIQTNPKVLPQKLTQVLTFMEDRRNRYTGLATTPRRDVQQMLETEQKAARPAEPSGRLMEPLAPEQMKKGEALLEQFGIGIR